MFAGNDVLPKVISNQPLQEILGDNSTLKYCLKVLLLQLMQCKVLGQIFFVQKQKAELSLKF